MTFVDLAPATARMAALIGGLPDDLLQAPTPCRSYTVADLLDHIERFTLAFTAAAAKTPDDYATHSSLGDRTRLPGGWRDRIPQELSGLAPAWRDPAARTGMTQAGGVELPGEVAAVVVLEELVIHGWDLARASGQAYDCEEQALAAVRGFVAQFAGPDQEEMRGDAYASPADVPATAPLLDRVIGLSGRDPGWSPS